MLNYTKFNHLKLLLNIRKVNQLLKTKKKYKQVKLHLKNQNLKFKVLQ